MNYAVLVGGWTNQVNLFIALEDLSDYNERQRGSSMFLEGVFKKAETETNDSYLVTEQFPDFVKTKFKIFNDFISAKQYIDEKRNENIANTYILFEKCNSVSEQIVR